METGHIISFKDVQDMMLTDWSPIKRWVPCADPKVGYQIPQPDALLEDDKVFLGGLSEVICIDAQSFSLWYQWSKFRTWVQAKPKGNKGMVLICLMLQHNCSTTVADLWRKPQKMLCSIDVWNNVWRAATDQNEGRCYCSRDHDRWWTPVHYEHQEMTCLPCGWPIALLPHPYIIMFQSVGPVTNDQLFFPCALILKLQWSWLARQTVHAFRRAFPQWFLPQGSRSWEIWEMVAGLVEQLLSSGGL